VDEFPSVELLKGLEQLLNDLFLVDLFKDVGPDDCVQVSLHVVKDTLNVFVILSSNHVEQAHYVFMPI